MAEQIKEVIKQQYVKCAQDPAYFMKKYCMIQHPIRGKIPFELYEFQDKTVKEFKEPFSSQLKIPLVVVALNVVLNALQFQAFSTDSFASLTSTAIKLE